MGTRKHVRGKESRPGTDENHSGHNPKKPGVQKKSPHHFLTTD